MSDNSLNQPRARLHPLVAGAAAAVIIASAVGVAAMTGNLPGSKAQEAESQAPAPQASAPAQAKQATPAQTAQAHAAKPAHSASKPVQVASAAPTPSRAVCAVCGTVVDVKEVTVKGEGSGVGAVAGGVAGGVLAHEVFDGKNQGLATIAGAAGGAFAGNAIEKNVKTKKHYDVAIRMDDGSTKTIAYAEQPSWKPGDKVKVDGPKLTPQ